MSTKSPVLKCLLILSSLSFLLWGGSANANPVQPNQNLATDETEQAGDIPGRATKVTAGGVSLERELLAKAAPDECYAGIGNIYPPGPPCGLGFPKVNQAFVWGLAKTDDSLWFGTAPNAPCLVFGGYLSVTLPHETDSWVCEFGESQYSPPLPEVYGDWRPPHIYLYDLQSQTLSEKSLVDPLFYTTSGIRSAGVLGSIVILGGPSLTGGINLFAFHTKTQAYLGSINLPEFTNIRKWLLVNGVLYTAVRNADGSGNVLRWQGDATNPFQYEIVGNLASEGAELAFHQGRIFVSTWPYLKANPPALAGLYMSPILPEEGLTAADSDAWQKVWQSTDYEPDPVTAATYAGGALASFDGYLYWGTMHVPFVATLAHINVYGEPETQLDLLNTILRTHRAISIFRGKDFGTASEEITLLYGEIYLSVYNFDPQSGTGVWKFAVNKMNAEPLWGKSGFDNFYNNYTWTMAVFHDQLYVGTMDWSYLFQDGLALLVEYIFGLPIDPNIPVDFPTPLNYGADLYRFSSFNSPAIAESLDGVGNYSNYGIRTMISEDALYLGTANPMNLMTDPSDDKPEGGWELLRLSEKVLTLLNTYLPMINR
jgi:hypothetical protein